MMPGTKTEEQLNILASSRTAGDLKVPSKCCPGGSEGLLLEQAWSGAVWSGGPFPKSARGNQSNRIRVSDAEPSHLAQP